MKTTLTVILSTVIVFTANLSFAGRYELIKGKGVEVCEAYGKNLNSFSQLPYPMACERKINPEMKYFKKPEWKELDAWENREMIKNIESFLGNHPRGNPKDNLAQWEDGVKDRVKIRHLRIELAQVDIDNDGKNEDVIKNYDGQCGSTHLYGTPIFVLSDKPAQLDMKKTQYLFQNVGRTKERPFEGWHYAMYDIFLYKGKAFFDMWSNFQSETGFLHVYKTDHNRTDEICAYQYHSK
jgi:hypothetical protein